MKKRITFNQLKRLVKESPEPRGRKWGDIKRELIGERNDEDPVTIDDMPSKLVAQLKAIGCQLEDNETTGSTTKLPYVWALISSKGHVPKGVVKKAVEKFGWHIIDTEPPYEGEPRFTFWLSPYGNPHEPGADFIDRLIDKDRADQAEREREYAADDDGPHDEVHEDARVKESEDSIDFKFINSTLDQIVKTVSDCKRTLQDLYRDARYGKAPATMERRQKVMQAMSDIRNLAHDISQEVK